MRVRLAVPVVQLSVKHIKAMQIVEKRLTVNCVMLRLHKITFGIMLPQVVILAGFVNVHVKCRSH